MYAERVIEEPKKDEKTDFSELSQPDYQQEVEKLVSEKHQTLDFDHLAEQTYETVVEELYVRLGMIQERQGGAELLDALLGGRNLGGHIEQTSRLRRRKRDAAGRGWLCDLGV